MIRTTRREAALDVLVLLATLAAIARILPPALVLSDRAPAGGDLASHFATAEIVAERFLPGGRLLGWVPDQYAGFPLFQPYFPSPFVAAALLAPALGLARAFNLVSVAGVFLLPLAAYGMLRALRLPYPTPAIGAATTLFFLLDETNTVWGGNLLATLTGELAYALALPLVLLFVGCAWRDLVDGRSASRSGLLLALVALTHGYAFLFAATLAVALVLCADSLERGLAFVARIALVSGGLIAFWMVPALLYSDSGVPYRDLWPVSLREALPPAHRPLLLVALAVALGRLPARRPAPARARLGAEALLWLAIPTAWLLYRLASRIGVVDIRFLPFAQIFALLGAAIALGWIARRLRGGALLPFAVVAAAWAGLGNAETARRWAQWNYSGFESKPAWAAFDRLQKRLAGEVSDPRVAWEHSSLHEAVGAIRAFESTPRFSGRSTLEGLYNQSSATAPFVFFLQSEISREQSCPFPDYHCSGLGPDAAAEHLALFAAPQVVVRSAEAKRAFERSTSFELDFDEPPYRVFRLRQSASDYVVPLAHRPLAIAGLADLAAWRVATYRWFQKPGAANVPLLRPVGAPPPFAIELDALPVRVPAEPLPDADAVHVESRLGQGTIAIRTSHPGHPLLVKVSHHPRWRTNDGSAIRRASPNFMLVVPASTELELRFSTPPAMALAGGVSGVTLLLIVLRAFGALGSRPWPRLAAVVDRPAATIARVGRWQLALGLGVLSAIGAAVAPAPDARAEWRRAERETERAGCTAATPRLERVAALAPVSYSALSARLALARCDAESGRIDAAIVRFRSFVLDYPTHPERPPALYELAELLERSGDRGRASRLYREVVAEAPDSEPARRASERLLQLGLEGH